ncbi:hypothetical protein [Microseira sp. BLCC-F43]|uniref:hypothetical protein n=1 Tax=Microseira sp. BLCC-F43 TaxID=3153602 RepID=UPI0035B97ACF
MKQSKRYADRTLRVKRSYRASESHKNPLKISQQIYRRHPQGCGYTNSARLRGLKLLQPAYAGFVCLATRFSRHPQGCG